MPHVTLYALVFYLWLSTACDALVYRLAPPERCLREGADDQPLSSDESRSYVLCS